MLTRLALLGTPRLIATAAIARALGDRFATLPPAHVELMTAWGPGRLCGVLDLPDPTERDRRFDYLQALRLAGHWGQLSDRELPRGIVLGTDRTGGALFALSPTRLVLLRAQGDAVALGSFEQLVETYLLGRGAHSLTQHYSTWDHPANLGIPATYATEMPAIAELHAALAAGDESAIDAALAHVLETDAALFALLDLMVYLASPEAQHVPAEQRAGYADQCYRMAGTTDRGYH